MARQIADSIISMRSVDSKDLAQRFVQEFENQPFRGYGASVGEVFHKLKKSKCQDPFKPASEQFNGSGSYGKYQVIFSAFLGFLCNCLSS